MIIVGKRTYVNGRFTQTPTPSGFRKVIVMIKTDVFRHEYDMLSPYNLHTDDGVIVENKWQFSKVYRFVLASSQTYSGTNKTQVWSHPAEVHTDEQLNPLPAYYAWRHKGFASQHPIRYPVGMQQRKDCLYSFIEGTDPTKPENRLNYIQARMQIYYPEYVKAAMKVPHFHWLLDRLRAGENLHIIEVDGPHLEDLEYYKAKYGVGDDFITQHGMVATQENLRIMANDPKHPFGHGYCLATALINQLA